MVKVDLSGAQSFFEGAGPDYNAAAQAHRTLSEKTGPGNDFIGWPELPETIKEGELKRLVSVAQKIRSRSKYLVVIGIGGSYLGARGAIELLKPAPGPDDTKVIFVGNGLNPARHWNRPSHSVFSALSARRNTVIRPRNTSLPQRMPHAAF